MKRTFLLLFLLMQFWSSCQQHEPSSKVDQEVLNNCMICHDNKEMQRGPILDGLQATFSAAGKDAGASEKIKEDLSIKAPSEEKVEAKSIETQKTIEPIDKGASTDIENDKK